MALGATESDADAFLAPDYIHVIPTLRRAVEPIFVALIGLAGTAVGAGLLYIATRKRDRPTIAVAERVAETAGAKAASEAWAEMAEFLSKQIDIVRAQADACRDEVDVLRRKVIELERRLDGR